MLAGSIQNEDAGAGQRYAELVLRNTSQQACSLYGYGGMQLIGADGSAIPTTVSRNPAPGPALFLLNPGESARATLHWAAVPADDETGSPCEPVAARAEVIPPDETDALTVKWPSGEVCQHGQISGTAYHK